MLGNLEDFIDVVGMEITNSDGADNAIVFELLHGLPGVHVEQTSLGSWPVNQVQIQVVKL